MKFDQKSTTVKLGDTGIQVTNFCELSKFSENFVQLKIHGIIMHGNTQGLDNELFLDYSTIEELKGLIANPSVHFTGNGNLEFINVDNRLTLNGDYEKDIIYYYDFIINFFKENVDSN
ncbi:hypothetical protein COC69_05675 [Bacillus cereus]|uniref:Uncharacterized protein n=1 Tax=Bacillus cereus TaxID=1396 RepID=A0A9X7CQS9_BACCE|nr:hypothetical protein [Bacillus cereus]PGS81619.1 hypothetical protein COC69_05675 [Bacillus cereus]